MSTKTESWVFLINSFKGKNLAHRLPKTSDNQHNAPNEAETKMTVAGLQHLRKTTILAALTCFAANDLKDFDPVEFDIFNAEKIIQI